jgi:methionyl-tRNA formyltransferase
MSARIVFMGSPDFALPVLRRLLESEPARPAGGHEVVAVYTQPDRPAGRGRTLQAPPAKRLALAHGVPVFQPARVSAPDSVEELAKLAPDLIVIAAYGQILKQPALDLPRRGVLNVHASLLPRHRGAAPVAAAILAGDDEAGVTIMQTELALDAGPILAQRRVPISPHDTTGTLTERLAEEGADLLMEVLPAWLDGSLAPTPQDASRATYAPILHKEDGRVDWGLPAEDIWRRVRAFTPWPGAFTYLDGQALRLLDTWPLAAPAGGGPASGGEDQGQPAGLPVRQAGTVVPCPPWEAVPDQAGFAVVSGWGLLAIMRLQLAGRRALPATDFLRGQRDLMGKRLG